MDGTLTVAVHDFDAIRRALGVPPREPILEWIEAQPVEQAASLYARLDELEMPYAAKAQAQRGAPELLETLVARGASLGIVTRNSVAIAHETLRHCGLDSFFGFAEVIGRESAPPKPSPDGLNQLLDRWGASGSEAVMVGDYVFDLEAGDRAGCATVYYDPLASGQWRTRAHHWVRSHGELLELAGGSMTRAGFE